MDVLWIFLGAFWLGVRVGVFLERHSVKPPAASGSKEEE